MLRFPFVFPVSLFLRIVGIGVCAVRYDIPRFIVAVFFNIAFAARLYQAVFGIVIIPYNFVFFGCSDTGAVLAYQVFRIIVCVCDLAARFVLFCNFFLQCNKPCRVIVVFRALPVAIAFLCYSPLFIYCEVYLPSVKFFYQGSIA